MPGRNSPGQRHAFSSCTENIFSPAAKVFTLCYEVLLVEYTVAGFLPVMLASVSAATITQWIYGTDPAFIVPPISVNLLEKLPLVILIGMAMGLLGTIFCRMIIFTNRHTLHVPPWAKLMLAAAITGLLAIQAPTIMGVGYDTVTSLLEGEHMSVFLMTVLVCKLIASSTSAGLGIPGGLIGPSLFLGAVGGALTAALASSLPGIAQGSNGFHVMVGMSAMLGAVLQAPLTALVTVVELTRNPHLLFPALVAIVVATLVSSLLLRQHGVFEQILDSWGFDRINNPVHKALNRIGISILMNRSFVQLDRYQQPESLHAILGTQPEWILIDDEQRPKVVLPAVALSQFFELPEQNHCGSEESIDLLGIPAQRLETHNIHNRASVYEAWDTMNTSQADSLYVFDDRYRGEHKILGIITRESLERYYQV